MMTVLTKLISQKSRIVIPAIFVLTLVVLFLIVNELWMISHTAQDDGSQVKISIYNSFENYGSKNLALSEITKQYTESNPAVSIVNSSVTSERFYTKLQADFSANCAADVIISSPSYDMSQLYKRGYIAKLDSELQNDVKWGLSFDKSIMRFVSDNNAASSDVYGLPVDVKYVLLYYNADIFDANNIEEPKSYAELKEIISLLAGNNITPVAFGAKDSDMYFYQALVAMVENPEKYSLSSGSLPVQYSTAFRYLKELSALGAFPKDYAALTGQDARRLFLEGSAAMLVETNGFVNEIMQYANSNSANYTKYINKFQVIAFPADYDDIYINAFSSIAYNAGDFTIFLNKASYENDSKYDELMKFVKYLTSPNTLKLYLAKTNDIMAIKEIETKDYKTPLTTKCRLAIDSATRFTDMPCDLTYRYIWFSQFCDKMPRILSNNLTVPDLFDEVIRMSDMAADDKEEILR